MSLETPFEQNFKPHQPSQDAHMSCPEGIETDQKKDLISKMRTHETQEGKLPPKKTASSLITHETAACHAQKKNLGPPTEEKKFKCQRDTWHLNGPTLENNVEIRSQDECCADR